MNEQYEKFAVSLDREFEARLRAELDARLGVRPPSAKAAQTENDLMTIQPATTRSRRRLTLPVAASLIAVLGIGVVAVTARGTDTSTAPAADEQTPAPTTSAAPTTTIPPMTDAAIAEGVLLKNSEYDPANFYIVDVAPARMDAAGARQFPQCAAYIDTVFESPSRPAAIAYETFGRLSSTEPGATGEYVVVLPNANQAAAMLDAIQEPAFLNDCVPAYLTTLPKRCCAEHAASFPADMAIVGTQPPTLDVGADDILTTASSGTWTDEQGVVHGPEGFLWTAVRVGRVVAMIGAINTATDGSTVTSVDQFEAIVKRTVERAASAQHGRIIG